MRPLLLSLLFLMLPTLAVPASGHTAARRPDSLLPDSLPQPAGDDYDVFAATPPATPADSMGAVIVQRISHLLDSDLLTHTQLGLYVYDLTADAPFFAHNAQQVMRPASCQKVITAVAALTQLGTDYMLRTPLGYEGTVADSILHGRLVLRGGFDPLLGEEDVQRMVQAVRAVGIDSITGGIVCDRSMKDTLLLGRGWCWDDDDAPLTPLLYNGRGGLEQHLRQALIDEGIGIGGPTAYAQADGVVTPLVECLRTIDQVLLPMMKQSDNQCAEALFYHLAAHTGRPYADYKAAARVESKLLQRLGGDPDRFEIADGSGLSLYNYTSPLLLVRVLRYAWTDEAIRRHLCPALPIMGVDGTLRRRLTDGRACGNVVAKTGSVTGVSTLAGYCTTAHGHLLCFAIMNQGLKRTAHGRAFQDRVCRALTDD